MYAVVETGGKQYKVEKGSLLKIERLTTPRGQNVELERVLLIGDGDQIIVGRPLIAGAKVIGEVIQQARDHKVMTYKYKKRKHTAKIRGHRQYYTRIKVLDVVLSQPQGA